HCREGHVRCVWRPCERGDELQISWDRGFAAVPSFPDMGRSAQRFGTRIQSRRAGFVWPGTDGGIRLAATRAETTRAVNDLAEVGTIHKGGRVSACRRVGAPGGGRVALPRDRR